MSIAHLVSEVPRNLLDTAHNSILKFVDEVRDQGKGVCILNGVAVEILVVLIGSEASILFLDKEEGRCLGDFNGQIFPDRRFSAMNLSTASHSFMERG